MARPEAASPRGPALHVVAMYPSNGQGEECVGSTDPTCGVAPNTTIRLRFDRPLDPSSVAFEAVRLSSRSKALDARYDPVERVVTLSLSALSRPFETNAVHQIDLLKATPEGGPGFRAFDGAALEEGEVPLHISFYTSSTPAEPAPPVAYDCQTILREVFSKGCAGGACHARQNLLGAAPMGLWLDGTKNLSLSAIDHVAHQTELGDSAGSAVNSSPRFGVQMPLISSGNAGNSYLLYKLLVSPENYEPCPTDAGLAVCAELGDKCATDYPELPLAEGTCLPPSAQELERLREWLVRGEPMPIRRDEKGNDTPRPVYLQSLRALTRFINAGADCSTPAP